MIEGMRRTWAAFVCAAIVSTTAALAAVERPQQPSTITPAGGTPLPRAAEVTRTHLLGQVDVYTLAIYVDAPRLDPERLTSSAVPKVLRIEVRYQDDANLRRRVPVDWWQELVPTLEPAARTHLRRSFAALKRGDIVLVEYVPDKGTAVHVNRTEVTSRAHHDLMLAFLDHWLGQQPVSEAIKRALLGS